MRGSRRGARLDPPPRDFFGGDTLTARLGVFTTHPIHYQVSLFRALADAGVGLQRVLFGCRFGMETSFDPTFGRAVRWYSDELLDRVPHRFLTENAARLSRTDVRRSLEIAKALRRSLRDEEFDAIVLFGYGSSVNWAAMAACKAARVPVILGGETVDRFGVGPRASAKRALVGAYLRAARAYLPIGTRSERFYAAHGARRVDLFRTPYAVDNAELLHQADVLRPQQDAIRKELGLPRDRPLVLFLGKLVERKRPQDLLEAFALLRPRASLVFVGDGDARAGLEARAKDLGIEAFFMGFQPPSATARFYAAAEVFAFPSSFETWGLVVNEAMCFSLPVITTTEVPAATDLVHPGENGSVLPVGDVRGLAAALGDVLRDPVRLREMGERSRAIVSDWSHHESVASIAAATKHAMSGERS